MKQIMTSEQLDELERQAGTSPLPPVLSWDTFRALVATARQAVKPVPPRPSYRSEGDDIFGPGYRSGEGLPKDRFVPWDPRLDGL